VCWNAKPFGYSINELVEKLVHDASEPESHGEGRCHSSMPNSTNNSSSVPKS
jgi:hypothetical protein